MKPHGLIELHWSDNALLITTQGPFNVEGIAIAFKQIQRAVEHKKPDCWYRLDILDDDTLGCPQVMKVIGDSYKWSLNNDCLEVAVVCHNQLQASLLKQFIDYTGLNIKSFEDKEQALQHLKTLQLR